jgi:hypothetical protein
VDEVQPRYGDVFRRDSLYSHIPEGMFVAKPASSWDKLSGAFKRKEETV